MEFSQSVNDDNIVKAYGQFRIEQKDGKVTILDFLEKAVPLTATLEYEQLDVGREINLRLLYCGPEEPLQTTILKTPFTSLAVHNNAVRKAVIFQEAYYFGEIVKRELSPDTWTIKILNDRVLLFNNNHNAWGHQFMMGDVLLVFNDDSIKSVDRESFDRAYTVLDKKDSVLTVVRDIDKKRALLLTAEQRTPFVGEALGLLPVGFDALASKRGVYFEREGEPDFYIENGQYLTFDEYDETGESYRVMTQETFDDEWIHIEDKDI